MIPPKAPADVAGSQQSFKSCAKCSGRFVVVASYKPGTPPHEFKVMCPHCGAENPLILTAAPGGKIDIRKGRNR